MNIFENIIGQNKNLVKNAAKKAEEYKIPDQYAYAACKFNFENGVPFKDLYCLFKQWETYVKSENNRFDVNSFDYTTFRDTIQIYKKQFEQHNAIYNDDTISIREVLSFDDIKKLPFANFWCIRKKKYWNEYSTKEPPANFI